MINKKYFQTTFVALMAFGMSVVMSLATTLMSHGFSTQWFELWLIRSGVGFLVAFPTALTITPLARSVATVITAKG